MTQIKKRLGKIQITIMVVMVLLIGWGQTTLAQVRVCGSDWPVWEYAHGMSELKQLKGFTFRYQKYGTCINGFAAGKIDITFMTLYDFIATQRDSANGVIIAATDYSSGGDGIVLHKNFSSAVSLKGKKLGLDTNSISLYVAHLYLKANGLSLNDIQIRKLKGEFVSKAFKSDKTLAGIVGWNPNLDDAISAGGELVATSHDFPENVFDLIVVNRESLSKNRALYQTFVKQWFAAVNDQRVLNTVAKLSKVSTDEFQKWLGDAFIYRDTASSLKSFPRMKVVAQEIQIFFTTKPTSIKGKDAQLFGKKPLNIDQLFDDSFLK